MMPVFNRISTGPRVGLTTTASIRKFKFLLLGGRPMVGLQTLDLAIGVRVPASQPHRIKHLRAAHSPGSLYQSIR